MTPQMVINDQALPPLGELRKVLHEHVLRTLLVPRVYLFRGNPVIRINEDYICFGSRFQSAL